MGYNYNCTFCDVRRVVNANYLKSSDYVLMSILSRLIYSCTVITCSRVVVAFKVFCNDYTVFYCDSNIYINE